MQLGTADAGVLVHSHAAVGMEQVIVVREWDADRFHQRVLELESQGYEALRETYRITAEMDPGTGNVIHLHSIEMRRSQNSG